MKQSVNSTDFHSAFQDMGRGDEFSYNGRKALFEYLEEYEQDTGEEIELDVIALCCDYSEHESLDAWADDYGADMSDAPDDEDERAEEIRSYIQDRGQLIEFDGGIIVSSF